MKNEITILNIPVGAAVDTIDGWWRMAETLVKETEILYHLIYEGEGGGEHYANDFEIIEWK